MCAMQSSDVKPIQIQWGEGQVVFTPEDQDRFVKEAKWAISACQGFLQVEKQVKKFQDEFLARLRSWCEQNSEKVKACYVPFDTAQSSVFMVGNNSQFDFPLSESLTELEQTLDNEGWCADILQLPNSSPEMIFSFFDPSHSIQVYGNSSGTPVEGETQPGVS